MPNDTAGSKTTNWRPIETAPKDGTPVDLWVVGVRTGRMPACHWGYHDWLNGKPVGEQGWFHPFENQRDGGPSPKPTHWMPVPEPPHAK